MPLQNRVDPFGNLFSTQARGTMMGNRGGVLHNSEREIVRPYKSRRWITCVLEFKERHRIVMSERRYTELFFLDEATAFAAGHRPCAECRRADYETLVSLWGRRGLLKPNADAIDTKLHKERIDEKTGERRMHSIPYAELQDGAMVAIDEVPWLVHGTELLAWS